MKPIPAIVERDIVRVTRRVDDAFRTYAVAEANARERRLELGRALVEARSFFPATGRNAGGWSRFLAERKINHDVALDAMKYAGYVEAHPGEPLPTRKQAGIDGPADKGPAAAETFDDEPVEVLGQQRDTPPFRQLTEDDIMQAIARLPPEARKRIVRAARVNVKGGSGDDDRGTWCTSAEWARAVGPWELDPFSNPRSHIESAVRCMLEDGGDAFGGELGPDKAPGRYLTGNAHGATPSYGLADELTRVWIQPPYELVAAAIAHYGHTRFCALLRWSPDVKAWFPELWRRTAVVCHPWCERMEFEPPPGLDKSGDMPFPHALYYAHEADVTDEVRARCIVWRIDHDHDDARLVQPALQIVR